MIREIALIQIFGLNLFIIFGMLTFASLCITALIGYLNFHGNLIIPFNVHPKLAFLTIVLAIIHIILVMSVFFFKF